MQADADILIVEDSATQALRLQFYLQERGYVVATVQDGVQALHYLAGQRPRLVVCDVLMPHMDGYELCRRIRADEALRQVPVLMWTQLDTPEDAATGMAAGAVAVVRKPLGDEALHQAVQRLLGSTDTGARAAADGYVLIVEDSQTQAIQLEETLRDRGYQTRTAVNGREALEAIRQRQPALVVSDVRMPVMDGLQLCRALKQDPELCRIPVILLTSLSAPTDVLAALEVGADFHIPKPYQGDYLAARIAEVLARSGEGGPVVGATAEETVTFGGTVYPVTTSREQALRLLLSTYEVASQQNRDLLRMRAELQALNETLEQRVQERTAALTAEIAERVRAEQGRAALESQLLQAQKLESVGRLAGGVAHDFNNLLMGIMNYVELCRDGLPPEHPVRAYLDEIDHDAQQSADITRQLLAFARKQIVAPEVMDLNQVTEGLLSMLRRLLGADIDLIWLPGANLWPVRMDAGQLSQILANLCTNARDAIVGVGKVNLETRNVTLDPAYAAEHPGVAPGDYVQLVASDSGCGMSKEVLARVFEPFFTTKEMGRGTGLGLATVHGIIEQHHGHIAVRSEPGQGTTFQLYLPRVPVPAAVPTVAGSPAELARGTETILVADDEKSVRLTTQRFLERVGYTVLAAATPAEALNLVGGHAGPIDLLITDVVMPGMNGSDLARRISAAQPRLKCLFMSGYTASVALERGGLSDGVPFLAKPFAREDLLRKVRAVLDG